MSHNETIRDLLQGFKGNILLNCYGRNSDDEQFVCQTNGVISDSIVQNWTLSALDCYKINCNCKNCPITKAKYSFKCQMKHIVEILLKTRGIPNEAEILKIQDDIVA